MNEPIIRVECVDSAGNKGSALELSKVDYWPDDPMRWSSVWLVDSDSNRGRTVMTDDQLREFAMACLAALDGERMLVPKDKHAWPSIDPDFEAQAGQRECPCCGSWVDVDE